ncbi:MAG: TIGR00725 family protein [bacterium JZ-2024 1]
MKPVVAICGGEKASKGELALAEKCGRLIARKGAVLLTGGLGGIMQAASQGASAEGGLVVGILPGNRREDANPYVDIPIVTNMGFARNAIIVLSAQGIIAIGGESGTLSEVAFSLKAGKPTVVLAGWEELSNRFPSLRFTDSPEEAVEILWKMMERIG